MCFAPSLIYECLVGKSDLDLTKLDSDTNAPFLGTMFIDFVPDVVVYLSDTLQQSYKKIKTSKKAKMNSSRRRHSSMHKVIFFDATYDSETKSAIEINAILIRATSASMLVRSGR